MTTAQLGIADDPHGAAMLDYLDGTYDGSFHYVRDDDVATPFDISVRFRSYANFSPIDKRLCAMVRGRTLDIGCGSGKHVLGLRELGIDCVGIDNSPFAAKIWRRLGHDGLRVMSAFRLNFAEDTFDSVTLFANGLSMGGTPEGVRRLLSELHRVTRATGTMVLTNVDVTTSRSGQDRAYHRANVAAGRLPGQLTLRCRYRDLDGSAFPWLLVSPAELADLITATGWEIAELHGFPKGAYAARLSRTPRAKS